MSLNALYADVVYIFALTTLAGACIPLGGVLASIERISPNWLEQEFRHFLIAFGGGILVGAVAVVLVPEGLKEMGHSVLGIYFILGGGLLFFGIERLLGVKQKEAPQLTGVLLDYIPEAAALGGLIVASPKIAPLMAALIALQNLPEGFNAYRELNDQPGYTPGKTLRFMSMLVISGPVAGLLGYFFLAGHREVLGAIMLVASGGILYLIFQDIAPQSRLNHHWSPPLGAVFGFCLTMYSDMLASYS
ncbi:divalent heavy-metal cations transporter [Marinobacter santoriniensis NKSG1]|uniref:Divalent heavy-metal cations transporter n=1 Tax=Marinobacter santoriniensis NKSG1 TaxID=1288826 RepID=M7D746_9GAMM|nr:divalent heavy-metal cations transporter [Marinobacter santoriniensis]EMP56548.1 divalent heavy-metal cations transporter [Marinobacter santoriniensis NKSG1]